VKGYAAHERGTLDDVVKARNAAMSAQGPGQVAAAETQLSGALGRLIALSEAYPDLKANANFQQLASELSDLENKIAASRRFFNNAVQEYNTGISRCRPRCLPARSASLARISSTSAPAGPKSKRCRRLNSKVMGIYSSHCWASRSDEPGISRFRVHAVGVPRDDCA